MPSVIQFTDRSCRTSVRGSNPVTIRSNVCAKHLVRASPTNRSRLQRKHSSRAEETHPNTGCTGGVLTIEASAAIVSCSEGLLRQALWNLGENAVKYRRSEEQLRVEIHGHVTSNDYEFSVSDNGKGMSSWEISQAWKPFFRGKKAQSISGTRLGLSIIKRVIEASGGSVFVDSIAGRGTTFRIRLPLAVSEMAA